MTVEDPAALNARGNAHSRRGDLAAALACYEAALARDPGYFHAAFNRARTLLYLGQPRAALAAYQAAAGLNPGSAEAAMGQGLALSALRQWSPAVEAYDRAFALDPDQPFLAGYRLHARMQICAWDGFDAAVADLGARLDAGRPASVPFPLVALPLSAARQRRCAEAYVASSFAPSPPAPAPPPGERIRIGYFSADLHDHPTAYLVADLIEQHDRERFDVVAFSFGPDRPGPMRERLRTAFERFYDVRRLSAQQVCDLARGLQLDIAVDLKGFTTSARPEILALRPAPVQVSWLGFPMTTGAPFIDYLVADPVLIAADERRHYSERVAWMPRCYQPNDRRRAIGPATRREAHDLPEDAFVFCSFNAGYKITPSVFAAWMRILAAAPGSVLWLLEGEPGMRPALEAAARAAGLADGRLIFAPQLPQAEHLERLSHADLFLDSWPCGAHTTASDALVAGLPLLTLRGETFAGRVAASLLLASGLSDLVAGSVAAYEATAVALATDPARQAAMRDAVRAARASSPAFDTPAQAAALEALYTQMHARRLAGLPPDHLGDG
jgi:predicted O-linked N-acetylglucosamine transferase (SPINDLY family)